MNGRRRFWIVNGTLAAVVAVVAALGANAIFHKTSAHAAPRTVTAQLGTVQSTVSASGNISTAQSENVEFATSGTVTAVDVALGQKVNAGQVLATVDPGPAQAALTAAQDNLTAAQDNLAQAQAGGETPPQVAQDAATITRAGAAAHPPVRPPRPPRQRFRARLVRTGRPAPPPPPRTPVVPRSPVMNKRSPRTPTA
jgi:multidrug efflux pump subunit AcrA (membrane-fusion protein)